MKQIYIKPMTEAVEIDADITMSATSPADVTSLSLDDEEVHYSGKFSGGTTFDAKSRDDWGDLWEE